jgi:hypothetical protein
MAHVSQGLRPGLSSAVPVRLAQGRLYGTRKIAVLEGEAESQKSPGLVIWADRCVW